MPATIIEDKAELKRLYLKEKMTDAEIALLYGCAKMTVYKTRKRFGIKALKRWERHECKPTTRQLQIVHGSLLGDASVTNGKKGKYRCESVFEVKHCAKQKDYVLWKYHELKNLCCSEPKENNIGQWRARTFHHPFFSNLRKQWYPDGVKCIPEVLSELDDLALAVWYMDDGTLGKTGFLKISTCSFTENDHQIIFNWLKSKWGVDSHMVNYSGYRQTIIDLKSRKRFLEIVKPHIVPCLNYKGEMKWAN